MRCLGFLFYLNATCFLSSWVGELFSEIYYICVLLCVGFSIWFGYLWLNINWQEVIGKSVNGTTYAGLRARTTGAPQNHWWVYILLSLFYLWDGSLILQFCQKQWCDCRFGPSGDPRGAGIGTPEAIKLVWSCHREIIYDVGPVPKQWEIPPSTWEILFMQEIKIRLAV